MLLLLLLLLLPHDAPDAPKKTRTTDDMLGA